MAERLYEGQTFTGLRLEDEHFDNMRFVDCVFQDCTFDSCVLTDCAFAACTWTGCRLVNLTSRRTQIRSLRFDVCDLVGISAADWLPASRYMPTLDSLHSCRLKYTTFHRMALPGFSFFGSELADCLFSGCDLSGSSFKDCALHRTEFAECDLRRADFRGAAGYVVDMPTCKLAESRFSFPEAVRLLASAGVRVEFDASGE